MATRQVYRFFENMDPKTVNCFENSYGQFYYIFGPLTQKWFRIEYRKKWQRVKIEIEDEIRMNWWDGSVDDWHEFWGVQYNELKATTVPEAIVCCLEFDRKTAL